MADTYYPYVSDLITFDQLPDGLTFISDDLNSIFSEIRYQNFIAERSVNESTGYYQLNIVVFSVLQLDVGGTGIVLILNPDVQSGANTQSIIPVNLNWRWDILRYVRGFSISQFASDATAILIC